MWFRPEAKFTAGYGVAVRVRLRNQLQFTAYHRGSRDQLCFQAAGDPDDLLAQAA